MITANSFNEIYQKISKDVKEHGLMSNPRGKQTTELLGYSFSILDPSKALCTLTERKLNYAFQFIEACEYLSGESDPVRICFYNSNMKNFTNEYGDFDGAYGPRIKNQLFWIYNLLLKDPMSRQAILTFRDARDCRDSVDIPCTLSLQFLIRENKLNAIATMRSNDLLWGTPYDVFGFTFLQRALASWLKKDLGIYIHQVGSMHIYNETEEKLLKILKSSNENDIKNPQFNLDFSQTQKTLATFWNLESDFRNGIYKKYDILEPFNSYLKIIEKYCYKKINTLK